MIGARKAVRLRQALSAIVLACFTAGLVIGLAVLKV